MSELAITVPRRAGALALLIAIALAYGVGLFDRAAWTPDEPRDLGIAARMSEPGASWAVPMLGDRPFTEKPPLWFWTAAGAMRIAGRTPAVGRLANLLYLALTLAATAALARRLAGPGAARAAVALVATSALGLQVLLWARVDVALMATSAIGFLGVELALRGATRRTRLGGWTLLHVGVAAGFLAKSIAGPLFPLLALVALAAWERRWRALLSWPLVVGLAIDALAIAPWLAAVQASGIADARAFFGAQLSGRAFGGDAGYTGGHRRWFGMYLVEWPTYLLPWTLIVVCAFVRAARIARARDVPGAAAARFAIAAVVPALAALSCAATKRDIYCGPLLPGVAVAVGAWMTRPGVATALERAAMRVSAVLAAAAAIVAPFAIALAMRRFPRADQWQGPGLAALVGAGAIAIAIAAWTLAAVRRRPRAALERSALLVPALIALLGPFAARLVDASNGFATVARAAADLEARHGLVLLHPDETLVGALELYAGLAPPVADDVDALATLRRGDARVLARRSGGNPSDATTAACARFGLRVETTIALPLGRAYDVLAPIGAPAN